MVVLLFHRTCTKCTKLEDLVQKGTWHVDLGKNKSIDRFKTFSSAPPTRKNIWIFYAVTEPLFVIVTLDYRLIAIYFWSKLSCFLLVRAVAFWFSLNLQILQRHILSLTNLCCLGLVRHQQQANKLLSLCNYTPHWISYVVSVPLKQGSRWVQFSSFLCAFLQNYLHVLFSWGGEPYVDHKISIYPIEKSKESETYKT